MKSNHSKQQKIFISTENYSVLSNSSVKLHDVEREKDNKTHFFTYIINDNNTGDKNNAHKLIKLVLNSRVLAFGLTNRNDLAERIELIRLETRKCKDGLFDEMFKIAKQLLSTIDTTQKQLDNFLFIYGK